MTARTLGAGFFGAFIGAWLSRAAFKWVLDLPGDWPTVLVVVGAIAGAVIGVAGEREQQARAADPARE